MAGGLLIFCERFGTAIVGVQKENVLIVDVTDEASETAKTTK